MWLLAVGVPLSTFAQDKPYVMVLGVAQDGGYPHAGCTRTCCQKAQAGPTLRRNVVSLALVDPMAKKWWLFEATPDMRDQLNLFRKLTQGQYPMLPAGIFLTHAHIGHYAGLMMLGREVMNTSHMPVYVLPRMKDFLEHNGPWSQLVGLNNIDLVALSPQTEVSPAAGIKVMPFLVPHRDEFSETAGFKIAAGGKTYLFIPDINKWKLWDRDMEAEIGKVDIAFLDGTFYDSHELPGKTMSEVPHPFISETMELLSSCPENIRSRVYFIHFNHTNPVLWDSQTREKIYSAGYHVAMETQVY